MFSAWRIPSLLQIIAFAVCSALAGILLMRSQKSERKAVLRFRELFPVSGDARGRSEPWTRLFVENMPTWLFSGPWTELSELLLTDSAARTRLQSRVVHAGYYGPRGVSYVCAIKLLAMLVPPIAALVGAMLGCWSCSRGMFFSALVAGLGVLAPGMWLDLCKRRRQAKLRNALPDYLDLTTACLDGGMAMEGALQRVSEELAVAHPLLTSELAIVRSEMDVGVTIDVACSHFAERADLDEIRSLAAFMQQAQRFGTTMSDALRELSDMLRSQRELRAEEMAQKAAVKIILPTMFCIFPAVFVVLVGPAALQLKNGLVRKAPDNPQMSVGPAQARTTINRAN